MRLHRQNEVPDDAHGLLCRQSRLAGVVRLIIWCGVLAIPMVSGWHFGKPWVFWIFLAMAAVVIPLAVIIHGVVGGAWTRGEIRDLWPETAACARSVDKAPFPPASR